MALGMPGGKLFYGPVPSWRMGRSLGVDFFFKESKTCSFDCVYCQRGKTVHGTEERREFIAVSELQEAFHDLGEIEADYVTFSGWGEPTLASNLAEAIVVARSALSLPVAILTNASLMLMEEVRRDLAQADVVAAKIDAPNEELFRRINRPVSNCSFEAIVQGIRLFREQFAGQLALQMMFVAENKSCAPEMAEIARQLHPDEVQINTPLRPSAVKPLEPEDIERIGQAFADLNTVSVYQDRKAPDHHFPPGRA